MDKVCKVCQAKHHTLLYLPESTVDNSNVNTPPAPSYTTVETIAAHGTSRSPSSVLLSTALVRVHGPNGRNELCRALLDSTSQSHLITSSLATRLGIERHRSTIVVGRISNATTNVSEVTSFRISSRITTDISYTLNALVAPCVTVGLPTTKLNIEHWTHLQDVSLADPLFHTPGKI